MFEILVLLWKLEEPMLLEAARAAAATAGDCRFCLDDIFVKQSALFS